MFTGIIEAIGTIDRLESRPKSTTLWIGKPVEFSDVALGHSIAVNGTCLTVEKLERGQIQLSAVAETLARTTLKEAHVGDKVNLERALKLGDRMGGHMVTGHVDCVAEITEMKLLGEGTEYWIRLGAEWESQVAEKGSVTVDGISLTVAHKEAGRFCVSLVPHTIQHTTIQWKRAGSRVNLETDVLAKYVQSMLQNQANPMTSDTLHRMGY